MMSSVFQDLHPERLHRAIVYPTGIVYATCWNLVLKWFLKESTREKVLPAMSLAEVEEVIDKKYIPKRLVRLGG